MSHHGEPNLPADLEPIAERLRAERPQLSGLELDELRGRVRSRVHAGSRNNRSRRQTFMKSRMAITAMLVLGLVFSTAGAGLAVSGSSSDRNDAGAAQYRQDDDVTGVLGEIETVDPSTPQEETTQTTRQVEATGGGSLPFTGFAAIPVLLAGLGLLSVGLVMRRRSHDQS